MWRMVGVNGIARTMGMLGKSDQGRRKEGKKNKTREMFLVWCGVGRLATAQGSQTQWANAMYHSQERGVHAKCGIVQEYRGTVLSRVLQYPELPGSNSFQRSIGSARSRRRTKKPRQYLQLFFHSPHLSSRVPSSPGIVLIYSSIYNLMTSVTVPSISMTAGCSLEEYKWRDE